MVSAGSIAEAHVARRRGPNQDCCSGPIGGTNESAASFLAGSGPRMKGEAEAQTDRLTEA